MNKVLGIFGFAACFTLSCRGAERAQVLFLTFPIAEVEALGQIEKLNVVVECSWIAALKDVPELYNIEMGYDMPTQNLLEARPRLGAAAVSLSQWSGVIGVRIPTDQDAGSCFAVTATAEGRSGLTRTWNGQQLGLRHDA
jgi:hypothetical protein